MGKYIYVNDGSSDVIIPVEGIASVVQTANVTLTLKYHSVNQADDVVTITHGANGSTDEMKLWFIDTMEKVLKSNWKNVAPLQEAPKAISAITYA